MEQVEEICDHIALVNKGKKILDGTVKQVKQEFKENLFSIGTSVLPEATDLAPYEVAGKKDQSFIVKIREGHKPTDILQYLLQKGTDIHSFNEILPSLNEIFIRLVEGTPTARQFQAV
jgi:ABC-2 type transport system ATP-binding protein